MSPIWMASERNDSLRERNDSVRDVEADFLRYVCKDVSVEPGLIQLT